MRNLLKECLAEESGFVELRYHHKESRSFFAERGRVESTALRKRTGVGVRVLEAGTWGFASTSEISKSSIQNAIQVAKKQPAFPLLSEKRKFRIYQKQILPLVILSAKGLKTFVTALLKKN